VKIYNLEGGEKPGLYERSGDKVTEYISVEDAHKEFGCARWDDIRTLVGIYMRCNKGK